jgi:general L-amino acid transport system permease protein
MSQNPFRSPAEIRHPVLFWVHKNLFSSVLNTTLTLVFTYLGGLLLFKGIIPLFRWDWSVIQDNVTLIMLGSYPAPQRWRIGVCLLYALALGLATRPLLRRHKVAAVALGWVLLLPFAFIMVRGFGGPETSPFAIVKTNHWGGLLLSVLISLTCIELSLPLGLFLALGRRSRLPVIKGICVFFIEVVRGVPLVTILFVGYLIFPMALPRGVSPSVFVRALAGIVMFHSAYMAEAFRGGLQGISRTQYEAAHSLNLGSAQTMTFVILPQVLKRMIPVLVNSFTSALKDTSLISIIGMLDLIGISTSIVSNPKYLGGSAQVLIFEGLIYFVLCFSISKSSRSIEKKLGVTTTIAGAK